MRVNHVDGVILHQLENSVANEPHNSGFAQDGAPSRNGPLGKPAPERRPAIVDIFHDRFRRAWIINDLERTSQNLRTETQPVLCGDEMKTADAVARMHRPGVIEHVENAQRPHCLGRSIFAQNFRLHRRFRKKFAETLQTISDRVEYT
jgi:hypothetical protein